MKHPISVNSSLSFFVRSFMDEQRLWPVDGRALVAVSGGRDSMFLLGLMVLWRDQGLLKAVRALYIDHGTRECHQHDEKIVSEFCQKFSVELIVTKLHLGAIGNNFEHRARLGRQRAFRETLLAGERLYLGHHLDDSFEWSMLSRLRQGSLLPSLGIPVVRGPLARPLLCLSRAQISSAISAANIPYRDDPSNENQRFERNWLRAEILPRFKARHPQYLKHYVEWATRLSQKLGVNRAGQSKSRHKVIEREGRRTLWCEGGVINAEFLQKAIGELSKSGRGTLASEMKKFIAASAKGPMGPHLFSGGVRGFGENGLIELFSEKAFLEWEAIIEQLSKKIEHSQIPEGFLLNPCPVVELNHLRLKMGPTLVLLPERWKKLRFAGKLSLFGSLTEEGRRRGLHLISLERFIRIAPKSWTEGHGESILCFSPMR
jgi:tRNA(Ile)-lysidine synthetase-like protein